MKEVAVVLAGDKFDPALHIKQIYTNLHAYCTDFRLTVFTDQDNVGLPGVRIIKLPDWNLQGPRQLWWYKVFMFSPQEWTGPVFYMDLDTIIVNNIDKFWDWEAGKFCICQDFNRQFIPDYPVSNSSIMRFDSEEHHKLYYDFIGNPNKIMRQYRGDQDYITAYLKERTDYAWWPTVYAMSYKWEILHGGSKMGGPNIKHPDDYYYPEYDTVLPDSCSIVVFHGKPDPYDTNFGKKRLTVL
jgi:hypothetical protein